VFNDYLCTLRLFSRDLRLFLITGALVSLAWDGMRAVVFNLYLLRLDFGPEFVGLVNAVGALAFALFCPLAGAMGTRWGSRKMLITGLGLMAAGFCLLPLSESMGPELRTGWLLGANILTYLGFALYLVNGLPFMMDTTGREERVHAFSFHSALLPLAGFVGSLLAGVLPGILSSLSGVPLTEPAPYRYTLWLTALLLVPSVPVLLFARSTGRLEVQGPVAGQDTAVEPVKAGASRAPIALIVLVALLMALRFGGRGPVVTFFNVYMDSEMGISTVLIGVLSATALLISVPAALLAPLLVEHWGNIRTIVWGMIGLALFTLPLALIPRWPVAGLAFICSSAMFSVTVGPLRVFSQELVAPRWQATMASAFMMGAGMAFATVSLAGGYLIEEAGYRTLFLLSTGLIAAAVLLFWFYFRVPRGEMARPTVPANGE
jgi:MFS family permease